MHIAHTPPTHTHRQADKQPLSLSLSLSLSLCVCVCVCMLNSLMYLYKVESLYVSEYVCLFVHSKLRSLAVYPHVHILNRH